MIEAGNREIKQLELSIYTQYRGPSRIQKVELLVISRLFNKEEWKH